LVGLTKFRNKFAQAVGLAMGDCEFKQLRKRYGCKAISSNEYKQAKEKFLSK